MAASRSRDQARPAATRAMFVGWLCGQPAHRLRRVPVL
jgi:hypothetical protein